MPTGLNNNAGFSIHIQPDSPAWSSQLGNHIRWMNNLNLSSAELKLSPAELGTLEIRISADDDQTRVSFITSNVAAKELIESSLPRLRELLGQSGLLLEHGATQAAPVAERLVARGFRHVRSHADLAGTLRATEGQWLR